MILEGAGEFTTNGRTFIPVVGEESLIPAHVQHSVRIRNNWTARWLYG